MTLKIPRRSLLAFSATLPFAPLVQAAPCTLAAEQETGPFYIPDTAIRSDIAEDRAGIPLTLRLRLLDSRSCQPLPKAAVDIWQCDATGLYSGYTQALPMGPPSGGPPPGGRPPGGGRPPISKPSDELTFLRGIQLTDADGMVRFGTIFPGVYPGRTNHIHFKVRVAQNVAHTGQVFFPEDATLSLMQRTLYGSQRFRRTAQAEDGIFRSQNGAASMAALQMTGGGAASIADLTVAVDPTATPAPVRGGPPR
ncbi:intradiol ring-cleavage dioxygenase [Reyranella sp.]|uniref:intradiol ring-cleavage dioxygenase n=1 Tax=Reyranella sp. TaxID=1929291 RepID=UPI003D0BB550